MIAFGLIAFSRMKILCRNGPSFNLIKASELFDKQRKSTGKLHSEDSHVPQRKLDDLGLMEHEIDSTFGGFVKLKPQ